MVTTPGVTLPVPMAPIMLSPPPIATGIPAGNPISCAACADSVPIGPLSNRTSGRHSRRSLSGSIARSIFSDQSRVRMSRNPVPDASPASMQRSPVR